MLALAAAVLQIASWGFIGSLRAGGTWLIAGLSGAVQGFLGVVLLVLESLVL
jgi:hypothetical protein